MVVTNTTSDSFVLAGDVDIAPNASSLTIDDSKLGVIGFKHMLDALVADGRVTVGTPPTGYVAVTGVGLVKTSEAPAVAKSATASATNDVADATLAAPGAGKKIVVEQIEVGYSASPTGGKVSIIVDAAGTPSTIFQENVGADPFSVNFLEDEGGLEAPANKSVTVEMTAGGTAIVGYANVLARVVPA